jgi:hypothetical protein
MGDGKGFFDHRRNDHNGRQEHSPISGAGMPAAETYMLRTAVFILGVFVLGAVLCVFGKILRGAEIYGLGIGGQAMRIINSIGGDWKAAEPDGKNENHQKDTHVAEYAECGRIIK